MKPNINHVWYPKVLIKCSCCRLKKKTGMIKGIMCSTKFQKKKCSVLQSFKCMLSILSSLIIYLVFKVRPYIFLCLVKKLLLLCKSSFILYLSNSIGLIPPKHSLSHLYFHLFRSYSITFWRVKSAKNY